MDSFTDQPDPDAERLGQIGCFVVAHGQRRTGVARALLEAACDMLRKQGLSMAEANPSRNATTDGARRRNQLESRELADGSAAAVTVGNASNDSDSVARRLRAFKHGLSTGDPRSCDLAALPE